MHSQPHLHGSQRKPDRLLHPALLRRGRLRIELDPIISLHEPGKPVPRLGQGILLAETDARAGGERREGEPAPDRTTAVVGILPAFRAELQRVVAPEVGPPVHGVDVPEHLLALPDRDGAGPLRSAAHGQHGVPDRDAGVERDGLVEAQGLVEDVLDVPAGFQGGEVEGSGFRLLRGCHRGREGRRHETAELVAAGCVAAGEEDAEGLVSEFGFVLGVLHQGGEEIEFAFLFWLRGGYFCCLVLLLLLQSLVDDTVWEALEDGDGFLELLSSNASANSLLPANLPEHGLNVLKFRPPILIHRPESLKERMSGFLSRFEIIHQLPCELRP
ncbi:hypothetical protein KC344_g173 [Hortaea werneckii]|nr:hypothetical protein KC344_g173 [Hortaea werneckii]